MRGLNFEEGRSPPSRYSCYCICSTSLQFAEDLRGSVVPLCEHCSSTSVSLPGSVLPKASVQFECVNGKGSPSCGYWLGNGPGIVALYATGNLTMAPTTGLLFSVPFKVTASGSGGLGFFCVTSPSGPWLENCASVFNGSTGLNVNVQGGSFATAANSGNTIPIRQTISFDHLTATLTGNLTLDTTAKT